jgi:hypothetical protein
MASRIGCFGAIVGCFTAQPATSPECRRSIEPLDGPEAAAPGSVEVGQGAIGSSSSDDAVMDASDEVMRAMTKYSEDTPNRIQENLYLGSCFAERNKGQLQAKGITHVLQVRLRAAQMTAGMPGRRLACLPPPRSQL